MPSVRISPSADREVRRPRPKDAALPRPQQLELISRRPRRRVSFSEATRLRNLEHARELKSMLADIVNRQDKAS